MTVRRSTTAVVERNVEWTGQFATEPYEAAWASEALFFVRALAVTDDSVIQARVQISPDGMHWCDEGTTLALPSSPDQTTFCKVRHFGGWLRLAGEVPENAAITVIVYLTLKE
jgi:hypothetical protein